MPCHAQLTIADVRFSISCDAELVDTCPSPAYADFTGGHGAVSDVDIPVRLLPCPMSGLAHLERRFDAGGMWSLFLDGETRYIAHMGWGIESPIWAAEMPLDASCVRVHCGGVLVTEHGGGVVVSSPIRYPLDQILLTYALARRQGVLVHGAGVIHGGDRLWLLAGRSGAGKSTAAALLKGHAEMSLLSDDRIVVRRMGKRFTGYGTPWPGEARVAVNRQATLAGILFLRQSTINRIDPVAPAKALEAILPLASIPWYEPALFPDAITFCGDMVQNVPVFDLQFRPDAEAATMLAAFMRASALGGCQPGPGGDATG